MSATNLLREFDVASDENKLVGVVTESGRQYAVSLIWHTASTSQSAAAEARDSAARLQAGIVCVYPPRDPGGVAQFGLGESLLGHRHGMAALAPTIAAACLSSLLGAWRTSGGAWVVIAIRDDNTIVCDKAFAREEDASAAFHEHLADEWSERVCPAEWGVDEASDAPLSVRLKGKKIGVRAPGGARTRMLRLGALGLLVISAAGAGLYALNGQRALEPPALPAMRPPKVAHPWQDAPRLLPALLACERALRRDGFALISVPGWKLSETGHCDGASVNFTLLRTTGTRGWADYALRTIPGELSVTGTHSALQVSRTLLPPPVLESMADDPPLSDVTAYLHAHFAEAGIELQARLQHEPSDLLQVSFTVRGDLLPFASVFEPIHNAALREVRYDVVNDTWSVSASVYRAPVPMAEKEI